MCGIVGYIGTSKVDITKTLLDGLRRLEYRGYDSAGVAIADSKSVFCRKVKRCGKTSAIDDLATIHKSFNEQAYGIAHTRWATHGIPSDRNAHPHFDCKKEIFLVHNGIIENYTVLKKQLQKKKHRFRSETDTEVLAHLIEDEFRGNLEEAVRRALARVEGTYGLAVISQHDPNKIVVARKGSPLGIGLAEGAFIVASDMAPILPHTKQIIYLEDQEIAVIQPQHYQITSLAGKKTRHKTLTIDWDAHDAEKGGYPHFMLKEIFEQSESIRNSMRGRLNLDEGTAVLGGLRDYAEALRQIRRINIVACGTALHAGMVGKYMLEKYGGVAVETDYASEFRYRSPVLDDKRSIILTISQSGETADNLAAIREAARRGVKSFGIVNAVGSSIARETVAGVYNHAGPEIGVASTKAFTSQLVVLALFTLFLGRQRELGEAEGQEIVRALEEIPRQVEKILKHATEMKRIATKYIRYKNMLFLGRNNNYPVALEGALKLKEISYIHAEGYAAGEMKHGSIALIDKNFPSLCIVPNDHVRDKMISNIKETQARSGQIIVIATEGDKEIKNIADDVFYIPKTHEMLTPILTTIPLQLFAYYAAVKLGRDVDKPRNLAKSVTVE